LLRFFVVHDALEWLEVTPICYATSSFHRQPGKPHWFCTYIDANGKRHFVSTKTSDKKKAQLVCRVREQTASKIKDCEDSEWRCALLGGLSTGSGRRRKRRFNPVSFHSLRHNFVTLLKQTEAAKPECRWLSVISPRSCAGCDRSNGSRQSGSARRHILSNVDYEIKTMSERGKLMCDVIASSKAQPRVANTTDEVHCRRCQARVSNDVAGVGH
jgi:hypothetical protein